METLYTKTLYSNSFNKAKEQISEISIETGRPYNAHIPLSKHVKITKNGNTLTIDIRITDCSYNDELEKIKIATNTTYYVKFITPTHVTCIQEKANELQSATTLHAISAHLMKVNEKAYEVFKENTNDIQPLKTLSPSLNQIAHNEDIALLPEKFAKAFTHDDMKSITHDLFNTAPRDLIKEVATSHISQLVIGYALYDNITIDHVTSFLRKCTQQWSITNYDKVIKFFQKIDQKTKTKLLRTYKEDRDYHTIKDILFMLDNSDISEKNLEAIRSFKDIEKWLMRERMDQKILMMEDKFNAAIKTAEQQKQWLRTDDGRAYQEILAQAERERIARLEEEARKILEEERKKNEIRVAKAEELMTKFNNLRINDHIIRVATDEETLIEWTKEMDNCIGRGSFTKPMKERKQILLGIYLDDKIIANANIIIDDTGKARLNQRLAYNNKTWEKREWFEKLCVDLGISII